MRFYYVTDMHLDTRIARALQGIPLNEHTETAERIILSYCAQLLSGNSYTKDDILLLGGDVSPWRNINQKFYRLIAENFPGHIIAILGNHEVWNYMDLTTEPWIESLSDLIQNHLDVRNDEEVLKAPADFQILHNEIAYLDSDDNVMNRIDPKDMTPVELQNTLQYSKFIVLGGIGFSGCNKSFNALKGIYRNTIRTTEEDRELSDQFNQLYEKLTQSITDKPIIVLSHNPMSDWNPDPAHKNNCWYVSGHTHENVIDEKNHFYADNQIGYHGKDFHLKYFDLPEK